MTLEDFFTLTEMKDGLSTLGRVEELVSLMQRQRDFVLNNVGDAARQWSTVAGSFAATANKDCLNHFVQLNGLCFLNQWLQEALKCNTDVSESTLEGLVTALLATLESLPIDREKSTVAGLGVTVENLFGHRNLIIKEKAKILSNKWNNVRINDVSRVDLHNRGAHLNDESKSSADANRIEDSVCSIYPGKGETGEATNKIESVGTESLHSNVTRCSEGSQLDTTKDTTNCVPDQLMPTTSSNSASGDAILGNMNSLGSSLISNSCPENLSATEVSSISPAVGCASPVCRGSDADDRRDASVCKEVFDGAEGIRAEVNTEESNPCKSGEQEGSYVSSSGLSASLPSQKAAVEPMVNCNFPSEAGESCISKTKEPQAKGGGVAHITEVLPDGLIIRKIDDLETSYQREEDVGCVGNIKEGNIKEPGREPDLKISRGVDIMSPNACSKAVGSKVIGQINQKSGLGLEYEEIDALEVARQVAREVEREVVDYREPFSSSPEVNSGETMGVCSPEGKQDQSVIEEIEGNKSPNRKDLSDDADSPKEHKSRIPENFHTDPGGHEQNSESAKVTPIDHISTGKLDKSRCDFDLNVDVCAEEFDFSINPIPNIPGNVSAPIAVVAASRGAPSMPVTALHFEGEMGWKGSAATSAFRPASPRRTPDCEKAHSHLKRKSTFLEIDLNVAESEHDVAVDLMPLKRMPASSSLPSGDSSVEVSSKTAERLNLDLNRLGDEDISMNPLSHWRLYHQNGDQNMSSASSSSSRQPSVRDFDLNDNLCSVDADGSHNLDKSYSKASRTYGISRPDDRVIRIMGSRMAMERNDYVNQAHPSFLGNGLNVEMMMAARPALPSYSHMPSHYGYNGHPMGPTMHIPPAFYGPGGVPYMVDSRGSTVVPQVLGSAGVHDAASVRPPFLTSVTGATSGLNGVGPSRSGLDLNSGMVSMENGSREGGSFNQLFMHGHNGLVEQARISSRPPSPGLALKRKEPDCGWEPYALGCKQVTSWQ